MHNSSEFFWLKYYVILTKRAQQCRIFQTFECCNESSPYFSCHFWNHKVRVYWSFASLFSVMKDNSFVFFLAQTSNTLGKNSLLKLNLRTFEWLGKNSPNASLFSVMKHNSSVFFLLNLYMLWPKGSDQIENFKTFDCSHENYANSLCHFSSYKSVFF